MAITLGFCSGDPDKEQVFWARPTHAPDHVDDEAIADGSSSSAAHVELIFSTGSYHTLCRTTDASLTEAARAIADPLPGGVVDDKAEWMRIVAQGDAEAYCGAEICALPDGAVVRFVDLSGSEAVDFVARITNAMVWLIDGCTMIEIEDGTRWRLFTIWREHELLAAATVYTFLVPFVRMRVCQFFTAPAHQRRGLGAALLEAVYQAAAKEGVVEVNVEDPSEGFTALRDVVDARRARGLRALIDGAGGAAPPAEAVDAAQRELLLSKEQAARVVELLRHRRLDELAAPEATITAFRIECKKRLLKHNSEALMALEPVDRKRQLGDMFDRAATHYKRCARKLA
jgi:GNAT superfamily N-acetyltransferase